MEPNNNDLEMMIEKYCTCCGTQRCIPWNEEDRMGCPHFNPEVKKRQEDLEKWVSENIDVIKGFLKNKETKS